MLSEKKKKLCSLEYIIIYMDYKYLYLIVCINNMLNILAFLFEWLGMGNEIGKKKEEEKFKRVF